MHGGAVKVLCARLAIKAPCWPPALERKHASDETITSMRLFEQTHRPASWDPDDVFCQMCNCQGLPVNQGSHTCPGIRFRSILLVINHKPTAALIAPSRLKRRSSQGAWGSFSQSLASTWQSGAKGTLRHPRCSCNIRPVYSRLGSPQCKVSSAAKTQQSDSLQHLEAWKPAGWKCKETGKVVEAVPYPPSIQPQARLQLFAFAMEGIRYQLQHICEPHDSKACKTGDLRLVATLAIQAA